MVYLIIITVIFNILLLFNPRNYASTNLKVESHLVYSWCTIR